MMGAPGVSGTSKQFLDSPVSASYGSSTEEVAIADFKNKRISIFKNFQGPANRTISHPRMREPVSVAFHPSNGKIFVADTYNMTILVFNSNTGNY
jgi:DNA-binding beta-propeller fold protein YncE